MRIASLLTLVLAAGCAQTPAAAPPAAAPPSPPPRIATASAAGTTPASPSAPPAATAPAASYTVVGKLPRLADVAGRDDPAPDVEYDAHGVFVSSVLGKTLLFVPFDGGAARKVLEGVSSGIAADPTSVYVETEGHAITSVPRAGGAPHVVWHAPPNARGATGMLSDGKTLFVDEGEASGEGLYAIPLTGGGAAKRLGDSGTFGLRFLTDDAIGVSGAHGDQVSTSLVPKKGGAARELPNVGDNAVVEDDDAAYMFESDDYEERVAGAALPKLTRISKRDDSVREIAPDAAPAGLAFMRFVTQEEDVGIDTPGTITRFPLSGKPAQPIANGVGLDESSIVEGGGKVYWVAQGELRSAPVPSP